MAKVQFLSNFYTSINDVKPVSKATTWQCFFQIYLEQTKKELLGKSTKQVHIAINKHKDISTGNY
jgi:hypothetical protein